MPLGLENYSTLRLKNILRWKKNHRLLWEELTSTCVGHIQETCVAVVEKRGKSWGWGWGIKKSLLVNPSPHGWVLEKQI